MKRTLLGTAALLTALTGPASAGPGLDAFTALLFEGAEVSYAFERSEGEEEVYEGLVIRSGDDLFQADMTRIRTGGGAISLNADGVRILGEGVEEAGATRIALSLPLGIGDLSAESLLVGEAGVRISPELCEALRVPVSFLASDLSLDGGSVKEIRLDAVVSGPDEACLLDLTQGMSGLILTDPTGFGVRIAEQRIAMRTPVTPGIPEIATGETWSSEFSLSGIELTMNGAVEVRLEGVSSRTRLEGDTLLPLGATGQARAMAAALSAGTVPEGQLPWADIWNALRAVTGDGEFRIKGLEVVGTGLSAMTGIEGPLLPGSRVDLSGTSIKDEAGVRFDLAFDGSKIGLLEFGLELVTGAADPSFNTLPYTALLTGAPISLKSAVIRFSDLGVGTLVGQTIGMDPYLLLSATLPGWVGSEKAGIIADWLTPAREGRVSVFRVAPAEPVQAVMIGMMALGDWSLLGALLNLSTE
jgi:hypothetical protein